MISQLFRPPSSLHGRTQRGSLGDLACFCALLAAACGAQAGEFPVVAPAVFPDPASPAEDDAWAFRWGFPQTLLWKLPLANPREPRAYAKAVFPDGPSEIETAIGAAFPLARIGPADDPTQGLQLEIFGAVFTRFLRDEWILTVADYRAGLPLTFAKDGWQAKLGYEHSSAHLGDEYILWTDDHGIPRAHEYPVHVARDEIVLGLARQLGSSSRLYGQFGYSLTRNEAMAGRPPTRYDWGLEWSPPTWGPLCGGPFAAFDMDLRAEHNFTADVTLQLGWQWKRPTGRQPALRVAAEYYGGRSPFGQFYDQRESWWAVSMLYDW